MIKNYQHNMKKRTFYLVKKPKKSTQNRGLHYLKLILQLI
ncbi:hypothetical protein BJAB0715_p0033 (plasmid) [Acinetobacter baumannii BJAB0715]|uniref:Uncharacterized protein n=1 Tax=Acinetobacter pittii TaxID=48296 RepID=A0A1W5VPS4_ACIPI|nr:hypothetical protein BJAB0715_p0033 [Acinetobacter baumannii BJAB0715]ARG47602.1 hypothetical protein [Acinetobacter pittii]